MPSQSPTQLPPSETVAAGAPRQRRNPWPIAITLYFIVFISFLVTFAVFATRQHVDLVQSDYYEQEVRFQDQLDRVTRTQALTHEVRVTYDTGHNRIVVSLPDAPRGHTVGAIHLYRPSDAQLDREVQLALDSEGQQQVDTQLLQPGLWKVRVRWAVDAHEYYFDKPIVVSRSKHS